MKHRLSIAIALFATVALAGQTGEPQPQDATAAVLAAFDRYDVVGLNAAHGNAALDEFLLSLVRRPELAGKVADIAVECGNRRYQSVLDRYIAGDDIPLEEAQPAWRNTSVSMCGLSGFYASLFPMVRQINQGLPAPRRFRVLALDPPVDWDSGTAADVRANVGDRNASIASVMASEVLAKKRKALVFCGVGHLYHGEAGGSAVALYERTYPGRTFVVETHNGFAAFVDFDRGHQLEARMRSWPAPSIVTIKGSWLADLDLPYFLWPFPRRMAGETIADMADAYLYLGPADSLTWEKVPASILDDEAYMSQMSQRFSTRVAAIRQRNDIAALYTWIDRQEARQFAPGAEFVGTYADAGQRVEVDFHGGRLAARLAASPNWLPLTSAGAPAHYRFDAPNQEVLLEFETTAGSVTDVVLDSGTTHGLRLQRVH